MGGSSSGERISFVSAMLLYAFMFFHWFGVKTISTSNLLVAFHRFEPAKSAWDALDYIPIFLVITILATLAVVTVSSASAVRMSPIPINAVVAVLGAVSVGLIAFRIIDPPVFLVEDTLTLEGAVQFPIFLALAAAAGVAFGGFLALWEEVVSPAGSRIPLRRQT